MTSSESGSGLFVELGDDLGVLLAHLPSASSFETNLTPPGFTCGLASSIDLTLAISAGFASPCVAHSSSVQK